jgi:hypothetical protein
MRSSDMYDHCVNQYSGIGIKLVRNFEDGGVDYRLLITEDKLHILGLIMVHGVKDTRWGEYLRFTVFVSY